MTAPTFTMFLRAFASLTLKVGLYWLFVALMQMQGAL